MTITLKTLKEEIYSILEKYEKMDIATPTKIILMNRIEGSSSVIWMEIHNRIMDMKLNDTPKILQQAMRIFNKWIDEKWK